MDIVEQFEYPLPILKTDIEKIVIETANVQRGSFTIVNTGGGTLSGLIMSNTPSLTFSAENFTGNEVRVDYEFINSVYKCGDTLQSSAVIMSNGGEKNIPVIIKIIPGAIITKENFRLVTIKDYLTYAKKYPVQARQLFLSAEFYMWLVGLSYEYMDIYEHLTKDPNKERALENFFILSKVKNRASLALEEEHIQVELDHLEEAMLSGVFTVKKTGWGFIDCSLKIQNSSSWLKLDRYQISQWDFGTGDKLPVTYYVDASGVKDKISSDSITFSDGLSLRVTVKRKPLIKAHISKEFFTFEDSGALIVHNNSGRELTAEVSSKDPWIKFSGKKYPLGKYTEIPFLVKHSTIMMAHMGFKKQPSVSSEIYLRCAYENTVVKRTFAVTMGNALQGSL